MAIKVWAWFALKALRIPFPSFGILQQPQTPLQIFIFKVPFFLPSGPVLICIAFILPGMNGIEVVKFGVIVDNCGGLVVQGWGGGCCPGEFSSPRVACFVSFLLAGQAEQLKIKKCRIMVLLMIFIFYAI